MAASHGPRGKQRPRGTCGVALHLQTLSRHQDIDTDAPSYGHQHLGLGRPHGCSQPGMEHGC